MDRKPCVTAQPVVCCSSPPAPATLWRGDAGSLDERLGPVVDRHFDPNWGSPFWLERARARGFDARRELRRVADLELLGGLDARDLRERSVWDFVPRSLRLEPHRLLVADSGGTTGRPARAVFTEEEFHDAFVAPFLAAVDLTRSVPRGAVWLFIGPSGPHAIGKAARAVCRAMGAPDPFSVDFDPRWFKTQRPGSCDRSRYLSHVIEQALDVLRREHIEVIFSTPPVIVELAARLDARGREGIAAIHLGGLAATAAQAADMAVAFPHASFLTGYGNSLGGLCPQIAREDPSVPTFYPHGLRMEVRLVAARSPRCTVERGERGRMLVTRLDESFLIVDLLERDTALRVAATTDGAAHGFSQDGFREPRPVDAVSPDRIGIY